MARVAAAGWMPGSMIGEPLRGAAGAGVRAAGPWAPGAVSGAVGPVGCAAAKASRREPPGWASSGCGGGGARSPAGPVGCAAAKVSRREVGAP